MYGLTLVLVFPAAWRHFFLSCFWRLVSSCHFSSRARFSMCPLKTVSPPSRFPLLWCCHRSRSCALKTCSPFLSPTASQSRKAAFLPVESSCVLLLDSPVTNIWRTCLYVSRHILFCWTIWELVADIITFHPRILQQVFPKDKNIVLYFITCCA